MIQSTQKIIKIGSSGGVTIPAKDLKRQNIKIGDEVEVTVRPIRSSNTDDKAVVDSAKNILNEYKKDFDNLSKR